MAKESNDIDGLNEEKMILNHQMREITFDISKMKKKLLDMEEIYNAEMKKIDNENYGNERGAVTVFRERQERMERIVELKRVFQNQQSFIESLKNTVSSRELSLLSNEKVMKKGSLNKLNMEYVKKYAELSTIKERIEDIKQRNDISEFVNKSEKIKQLNNQLYSLNDSNYRLLQQIKHYEMQQSKQSFVDPEISKLLKLQNSLEQAYKELSIAKDSYIALIENQRYEVMNLCKEDQSLEFLNSTAKVTRRKPIFDFSFSEINTNSPSVPPKPQRTGYQPKNSTQPKKDNPQAIIIEKGREYEPTINIDRRILSISPLVKMGNREQIISRFSLFGNIECISENDDCLLLQYKESESAKAAMIKLNGTTFNDFILTIKWSNSNPIIINQGNKGIKEISSPIAIKDENDLVIKPNLNIILPKNESISIENRVQEGSKTPKPNVVPLIINQSNMYSSAPQSPQTRGAPPFIPPESPSSKITSIANIPELSEDVPDNIPEAQESEDQLDKLIKDESNEEEEIISIIEEIEISRPNVINDFNNETIETPKDNSDINNDEFNQTFEEQRSIEVVEDDNLNKIIGETNTQSEESFEEEYIQSAEIDEKGATIVITPTQSDMDQQMVQDHDKIIEQNKNYVSQVPEVFYDTPKSSTPNEIPEPEPIPANTPYNFNVVKPSYFPDLPSDPEEYHAQNDTGSDEDGDDFF